MQITSSDPCFLQKYNNHNPHRLGMMFPGFVPERGMYNMTYLNIVQGIVDRAAKYGIYTLLDMHQVELSSMISIKNYHVIFRSLVA